MFKKTIPVLALILFGAAGCSLLGGGLSAGDTAAGNLDKGAAIEELLPNSEEVLLAAGIAVENDWPAIEYKLKAGEGISLSVEEDDIDPVIVVVDADNKVIVAGDDWEDELDAFVSMDEVPEGARAIVFDVSGDDGEFLLEVDEADDYQWMIAPGEEYELSINRDKENDQWDDLLRDIESLYRDRWETCRVFPLNAGEETWLRIELESNEDLVMAVLKVDGDSLEYIDYDDDTIGMNPVFSGIVEPGNYIVVVDTYSSSDDADFTLLVEEFDPADMVAEVVTAGQEGEWYSGEFHEGSTVGSYWPEAGDYYGILPEEQVLVFEFEITEAGEYTFSVSCSDDTKMAIIDSEHVMVDYNDDGPEGSLDPELTLQLSPGHYSALVVPYGETSGETVDFEYTLNAPLVRERVTVPLDEVFQMTSNMYMTGMFESGVDYEIFAESEDIDLTLTVVDRAGEEYFSDDDGGDLNPYLLISCTRANAGEWNISLESYSGIVESGDVYFVVRPAGQTVPENSSAAVGIK